MFLRRNLETTWRTDAGLVSPPCRSGWMKSPMDPSTHSVLL